MDILDQDQQSDNECTSSKFRHHVTTQGFFLDMRVNTGSPQGSMYPIGVPFNKLWEYIDSELQGLGSRVDAPSPLF